MRFTPGPWKYNKRDNSDPELVKNAPLVIYHDELEEPGAKGGCEVVIAEAETEADARFIVRACNCHDELLAACKAVFAYEGYTPRDICEQGSVPKKLSDAIAEAERLDE